MTTPSPADPSVARTSGGRARTDAATSRAASERGARPAPSTRRAPRADESGSDHAADDRVADDTEVSGPAATDGEVPGDAARRIMGYRRQRFEARKVRRLIRHVDPWSMLKLAVLVSLCMWLIVMIAAVVLWTVARNAGTIANVEDFVNSSLSLQDWKLDGDFIFRQFGLITLLLALGFAAATVVASLVFNLISDIIGGVWVSVIEEETARPVVDRTRPEPERSESNRSGSNRAGSNRSGSVG